MSRGYCERTADRGDRRRSTIALSSRGRTVAEEIRRVIDRLNRRLEEHVDATDIAVARAVLATVVSIGHDRPNNGVRESRVARDARFSSR